MIQVGELLPSPGGLGKFTLAARKSQASRYNGGPIEDPLKPFGAIYCRDFRDVSGAIGHHNAERH